MSGRRWLPAGRSGLLLELGSAAEVASAYDVLRAAALPVADVVPGARTVLLDGVDGSADAVRTEVERLLADTGSAADTEGREVEVPVRYDGPDLDEVARRWDMTREEVVATHVGTAFVVAFCGFAPGFAYCTGLPERLHVPRRATPRTRVPAGSVGLAGEFTGIYPTASPGGWQLLGTTGLTLWDLGTDPPAVLVPGTRVRFTDVGGEV